MDGLLFLAHRIPYPPNKGDKIRSFHLLRHLAKRYRIHLGAFVDDPDDWRHAAALGAFCAETRLFALHPRRAKLGSLVGLLSGEALTLPYYRNAGLARWAADLAARGVVSKGVAFSSAMAQFMPAGLERRVMDMVDVDSDKWAQFAATQRWPLAWLYAREARRLAAWEARVAHDFDATLLVSEDEAALLRERVPDARARIGAFENGVDAAYFAPGGDVEDPYDGARAIVFTGAMDYWPNVDAVTWFADRIFPAIRERFPAVRFVIVGSRPGDAVVALARQPGVTVTGSVPDVRPYLAHAACAVAPLRIARGVQNKVLEAMAMARPVVVTPQAAEGIRATAGRDYLLAHGEAAFAAAVNRVLANPACALGVAARATILQNYDWDRNLAVVDRWLEPAAQPAGAASAAAPADPRMRLA
jgi:sugar transferase (PEP-CTERM/EpsH1 system associated)